ncbi:MAG: serine--tRNA ligase [Clostridiales bacterium]|nr:serine--tRNA ligase [Clostridiales bacterium]
MLDLRMIRTEAERVKERLLTRGADYRADIDAILEKDAERRDLLLLAEQRKARQNEVSREIPAMKKAGQDTAAILQEMSALSDQIKLDDAKLSALNKEILDLMAMLPNLPDESVPVGRDADDNPEMRRWGEPTAFSFEPKPHWELGRALDILDPEAAARVTGARFHFYKGLGARLERAVINFYLDTHTARGYTEILPPFIVNADAMFGTGNLPKFAEDVFKLQGLDYYLIPTAEVPVTNYYREQIMDGGTLPQFFCAYSGCFRAEAGSAGRDTRGLIRQHQFNKVELVKFAHPDDSFAQLEGMTRDATFVLEQLGLPHRVICLCTGDMGFCSAKTYDVEVWLPSYDRYAEISSCSNCLDFQARRANIRFKMDAGDKPQFVHTLNGSGVAIGRTVAAILENYQNEDGSVTVPEALRRYMGVDRIG